MGLFSSGKNKKKVEEAKKASEKTQTIKNNTEPSNNSEATKVYPDYGTLSPEEAKLVLAKRITEKINGVSNLDVEKELSSVVKKELITDDIDHRMEERRKKRLEVSEEKLKKDLQEEAEKDREYIEKSNIKVEELRNKQKIRIDKLQKKADQKERKKQLKEEKKSNKETTKILREEAKEKRLKDREERRKNSFIARYFESRNNRFAISDQKYVDKEKREKEREKLLIEEEKKKNKADKLKDKQDRKKYEEEISQRREAIVEREQKRARDMARRREIRIEETLRRRQNRYEERVVRERDYIASVAQREAMLSERAEKKKEKKNRQAYFKSLPKVEKKAEKEAYNREYQKTRYEELKKRDDIKAANAKLPRKERKPVPAKNPGSFKDRMNHLLKVRWKRILMMPVKTKHRMINRGAVLSNRLVNMIDFLDRRSDKINDIIVSMQSGLTWRYNRLRILSDRNKELLFGTMAGVVIVLILLVSFANFITGYEYSYNNRALGIVKSQEDVTMLVDVVNQQLSKEHEALIAIDKTQDITFKRVIITNKEIDDQEKVLRRLTYMQDLTAKGYGIYIDGKRVGIMSKEEEADRVLNRILNNYLSQNENTEYESVTFAEEIEIKEIDTQLGRMENVDDVVEKILTGGRKSDVHIVEPGETFAIVAEKHGITQDQLKESNPEVDVRQLEIGATLHLSEKVPMVKVQTVEITKYIEYIPHITTYEEDDRVWKGEKTTKVAGADGQREVVAKIVRNNGKEAAKMILEEKMISEPVTALILVGTKPLPPLQGTGELVYPVSGFKLTSHFGTRWGRMHSGVDLAAPSGTKIRAADGGTVILAGYNGQLGYCVEIDHGGNRTTVYGHCSKLYVSVGDKVYQGQHISDVGNTGRSTGPHLHFEVRELGVAKNPLSYL